MIFTDKFDRRKRKIQRTLFNHYGVKVDLCLQGHGTTNTGNLARKCLSQPELFDKCLELDLEYVKNLGKVLLCFKTKKRVDLDKLESFCFKIYEKHYITYPWARLNPTVHKLLRHGCEISRQFPLPI